jgi:hypothetical protein
MGNIRARFRKGTLPFANASFANRLGVEWRGLNREVRFLGSEQGRSRRVWQSNLDT